MHVCSQQQRLQLSPRRINKLKMISSCYLCFLPAEVYGGPRARGTVPAICPERRSVGDPEAPHVQDERRDADQHKLQRYMSYMWG